MNKLMTTDEVADLLNVKPATIRTGISTERLIFDADTAAAFLGIARRTLWRWTREGRVPHRKLGRMVSYRRDELLAWHNALPGRSLAEVLEQ